MATVYLGTSVKCSLYLYFPVFCESWIRLILPKIAYLCYSGNILKQVWQDFSADYLTNGKTDLNFYFPSFQVFGLVSKAVFCPLFYFYSKHRPAFHTMIYVDARFIQYCRSYLWALLSGSWSSFKFWIDILNSWQFKALLEPALWCRKKTMHQGQLLYSSRTV